MADDPYTLLGVQRGDSDDTIRAAYRKLAKRHHPDVNPGRPEAAERFKSIAAAYDLLSDPERRARFDRGEIDADGHEAPPRGFYRDQAGAGRYRTQSNIDPDDLADLFGGAFGFGNRASSRGRDVTYALTVSFLDAARGATRRIGLPDGRTLDVTIPPGLSDGQVLRLRGQGQPGAPGQPAGDALVEIAVAPDPRFRRDGDDIVLTLPVTLKEAVLGASVEVPTVKGDVRLAIPPNSGTGTRLRLRGRGFNDGHQFVELTVVLPPGDEPELAAFLSDWTPRNAATPRPGQED